MLFFGIPGLIAAALASGCGGKSSGAASAAPGKDGKGAVSIQKFVTEKASFVVYMPKGWKATEGEQDGVRTLTVSDPKGACVATMHVGASPAAGDAVAQAAYFAARLGKSGEVQIASARCTPDRARVVFDGTYAPTGGRREFRAWVSQAAGQCVCQVIEAPVGQLAASRAMLLTVLSNATLTKAAQGAGRAVQAALTPRQLKDGSATVSVPADWNFQDLGKGSFIAGDAAGQYGFMVAGATVLTGKGGVVAAGVPLSPYRVPSDAFRFLTGLQGLATNMQFLSVTPHPELAQQLVIPGRTAAANAEEFVYTYTNKQGQAAKGYSFGVTTAQMMGFNWGLWHITVVGPADGFDAYVGNFTAMIRSYQGNEEFAKRYIERGNERLRQMERETAAKIASNATYIRETMQAAYEERQKSQEYIDYQRTQYIRGQSDWVSEVEGGAVYHSDSWGTENTWTGEFWAADPDGRGDPNRPYNYVNFQGKNPKYNETMQEINTRALWEQNVYRKK